MRASEGQDPKDQTSAIRTPLCFQHHEMRCVRPLIQPVQYGARTRQGTPSRSAHLAPFSTDTQTTWAVMSEPLLLPFVGGTSDGCIDGSFCRSGQPASSFSDISAAGSKVPRAPLGHLSGAHLEYMRVCDPHVPKMETISRISHLSTTIQLVLAGENYPPLR